MSFLGYLALAWLLGTAVASWAGPDPLAVAALALGLSLWALFLKKGGLVLPLLMPLLVAGAYWHYAATLEREPSPLARLTESGPYLLRGVVDGEPSEKNSFIRYLVQARHVQVEGGGWQAIKGRLLVVLPSSLRFRYGDLLELEGRLEAWSPQGGSPVVDGALDATMFYPEARWLGSGFGDPVIGGLIQWRERLKDALSRALPEPEAALAQGVLLGRRGPLPKEVLGAMDATGTSHLLAASGQNVTLIAGLATVSLAWLVGARWALAAGLALTAGYALLVGGSAPVVRAAIMGGLYALAHISGRPRGGLQPLLLAGAGMLGWDPLLVEDISFQLSFASTLGLVLWSYPLQGWLWRLLEGKVPRGFYPWLRPIAGLMAITVAATAFTWPLTALYFGRASLMALVANVLVVPSFVPLLVTAGLAALAGSLWGGAASGLGWLVWPWAKYMLSTVQALASVPGVVLGWDGIGLGHLAAYGAVVAALTWLLRRSSLAGRRLGYPLPQVALVGLALFGLGGGIWGLWTSAPSGDRLEVAFLEVGNGTAVLVSAPGGVRILIDGGPHGEAISKALGRQLPFWERSLDLVVVTSFQMRHIGGLVEVLDRYHVGKVVLPPTDGQSYTYHTLQEAMNRNGVPILWAAQGQQLRWSGGFLLRAVYVADEEPVAFHLMFGNIGILILSSLSPDGQRALLKEGWPMAHVIYLYQRGGAEPTLLRQIVSASSARVLVLQGALEGLPEAGPDLGREVLVLRPSLGKDVVIATDGHRLWVEGPRGP